MKKRHLFILSGLVLLPAITMAQDSKKTKNPEKEAAAPVTDTNTYVFYPQTVYPLTEGPRMPGPGYDLHFSREKLSCYLPYIGSPQAMSYGSPASNNVELNTTEFTYTREPSKKKGEEYVTLMPKLQTDINKIKITAYDNGEAYVRISFHNRQNISYRGKLGKVVAGATPAAH